MIKGYKAFDKDLRCRGKQYAVGGEYEEDGEPVICAHGMHFCELLVDVFDHYPFDEDETRVCEVEALGDIARGDGYSTKRCTNLLKVIRELDWNEIRKLANSGIANTGRRNSGDFNSGDVNSGSENSGDYNSGRGNSGDYNSGHRNSGDCNSGHGNSGYGNSGNRNSGDRNSGDWNSGYRNSGHRNSGYQNSGDWNSGRWNSGDVNSGARNSGDRNSGDWNSGDYNGGDWNSGNYNSGRRNSGHGNSGRRNSGDRNSGSYNSGRSNSGDWNSGDWNVTDFSSGVLCTEVPECLIFDKPSGMTLEEWRESHASHLLERVPIDASKWVDAIEMTDEEKAIHPEWEVTRGYLREGTYKRDFTRWWASLNNNQKAEIFAIPNFDPDKFEKITGLQVHGEMPKRETEDDGDDGRDVSGLAQSLNQLFVGWTGSEIAKAIEQATGKTLR